MSEQEKTYTRAQARGVVKLAINTARTNLIQTKFTQTEVDALIKKAIASQTQLTALLTDEPILDGRDLSNNL